MSFDSFPDIITLHTAETIFVPKGKGKIVPCA